MKSAISVGLFALPRCAVVALLCVAANAVGRACLPRIAFSTIAERLLFCTTLGFGLLSHLILAIGLLGWLTPAGITVAIVGATSLAFAYFLARGAASPGLEQTNSSRAGYGKAALPYLIIGGIAFFPLLVLSLYPPT